MTHCVEARAKSGKVDLPQRTHYPPPAVSMKILFNRTSPVVRTLEAGGVVLSLLFFWRSADFDFTSGGFVFVFLCYVFLRVCDLSPWYKGPPKEAGAKMGIEVHFQKALVPTSYILFLTALACVSRVPVLSASVVSVASVMMAIIVPVNGILISFHRRDRDPLPINYFSSNQYKSGEIPLSPETPSAMSWSHRSLRQTERNESDSVCARSL